MPPAPRQRGFHAEREVRGNEDLATSINESATVLDEQVTYLSPLAVQIPEGVGADGTEIMAGMRSVYEAGTAEQQFAAGNAPLPVHSDPDSLEDSSGVRTVGEEPEQTPVENPLAIDVSQPVHAVPAVRREAAQNPTVDEVREVDVQETPVNAPKATEDPKQPAEHADENAKKNEEARGDDKKASKKS